MKKRVVVTGLGAVTPLGLNLNDTWKRVVAGESAADYLDGFAKGAWPTKIACEVKNFQLEDTEFHHKYKHFINRPTSFGLTASEEAIKDSGLIDEELLRDFGVFVGSGMGAVTSGGLVRLLKNFDTSGNLSGMGKFLEQEKEYFLSKSNHPGMLASLLTSKYKITGPNLSFQSACAASAQSIGHAAYAIENGEIDVALSGGADSIASEFIFAGFSLLGVMTTRNEDPTAASRPFDDSRDGFLASEGSAFVILEERDRALKRGAKIYCELVGYGESENAYRVTDLPPDGLGTIHSMTQALKKANVRPEQITYVNAHGTSTEQNDRIEAACIKKVLCDQGGSPLVSSTKSETGHLVAAAGSLEFAFTAKTICDGVIAPNINLHSSDCAPELSFQTVKSLNKTISYAISNSIGFGGTNASLLLCSNEVSSAR